MLYYVLYLGRESRSVGKILLHVRTSCEAQGNSDAKIWKKNSFIRVRL